MTEEDILELLEQDKSKVNAAVKTISSFQKGKVKPILTSYPFLNSACLGGLMPGLIISICARPMMGKSYTIHTLRTDVLRDKERNVCMLLYNWEMTFFSLLLVQLKKVLKKSFKEILSMVPTDVDRVNMKQVTDEFRDERLHVINKALSPIEFDIVTREYIEQNIDKELIVIGIDHIGITKGKNKTEAMYELMEVVNEIKLDYSDKVCFIILGQLNREIEKLWRSKETNPTALRVTSEYLFGADALMQYSDVIMAQVIPYKVNMDLYTSVNKERYAHLEPHFETNPNPTAEYVRLKGNNRVYFDFIKRRLEEDGEPSLYCELINEEFEEYTNTVPEKDRTFDSEDEPLF